ncbi:lytic transglycosylase domain-containing protein [Arsenophonus sp. PmNCSU2021_1]|uniref:lytic transglycosylase domain-containing protein n=1 Tax=Arsenophonus sp. PmNCSU2021_1 TaxID=3118989 RepID=UPI002FEF8A55
MTFWLAISLTTAAKAFCFNEAGAIYQIDPKLLKAIAQQESSLSAKAVNINRDRQGRVLSTDYGLMQINSTHIPKLQKMGVIRNQQDLLNQPCLNVKIGAWILAQHLRECGVNWDCLGSYTSFAQAYKILEMA